MSPVTTSALREVATVRKRFISPAVATTLSIPNSSSRLMKVIPEAVAGRCRWVTIAATVIRVPSAARAASAVDEYPRAISDSRIISVG